MAASLQLPPATHSAKKATVGHSLPVGLSCCCLLLLLCRLLLLATQQPCSRAFGSHDGQAAARTTVHDALAVRSPAEHDALAVLLGVSCASAQLAAAERRLMVAPFGCEKGLHTSFSY